MWGRNELSEVKFEGQKLSFARTIKFGDREFKMTYEGTLKDGAIAGSLSSDQGTFTANGARRKPRSPILGRWEFKYTVGDRDIVATLAISEASGGALEGKWTSNFGEHVVSNVKFQDGKLTLDRKSKLGDRELETKYEGALKDDKLAGTIKSEIGEIPAEGKRIGGDLIGKWDLETTSDQGSRPGTLLVFGDLTGRYETFGGEIPFNDLKLDGNQFAFSVEMAFGNQPTKLEFKGKIDGKTLKGEVTSPRGTREVTGKKVEQTKETAKPASAVAGTWEITRQNQQGQTRTAKLVIKEDMTATYTMGENTVPVTDLKVDGNQLSFKAVVKYGDREAPIEFKGQVDGTSLKGEITTARGTREATGKKVTAAGTSL
jgi:hypothetical protein